MMEAIVILDCSKKDKIKCIKNISFPLNLDLGGWLKKRKGGIISKAAVYCGFLLFFGFGAPSGTNVLVQNVSSDRDFQDY